MNRGFIAGLVLGTILTVCVTLLVTGPENGSPAHKAHAQKKGAAWKEVEAGSVPGSYGEMISVTGQRGALFLVFKDDEGTLRVVEMGNKISNRATKISRSY